MPGEIVDGSAALIPLPVSIVTSSPVLAMTLKRPVNVLPETMSQIAPRNEAWMLAVAGESPIFDIGRVVAFIPGRTPCWTAGCFDFSIRYRGGENLREGGDIPCIILGPGWESRSDELYWAIARRLLLDERDPMLKMAIEAMMLCHGRK